MTLAPGAHLGPYEIMAPLGAGGMGEVYRARDTRLERDVALKLLPATALEDAVAHARLIEEAKTLSALNHPHVCIIYEAGEVNGQTYVAMEYVEGRSLNQQIPHDGLPLELVVRYGGQIADALAYAHERGIIHRDLKSANVMITPEGCAKVLDFGLALRLTEDELAAVTLSSDSPACGGGMAGTLHYMAPEVLRGEQVDARSDIWALGVVLYEMAAGLLPFGGKTPFELTSAILREPLPPLPAQVPAALRSVIHRCMAKEPGQRYSRIGEVRSALETISSSETLTATVKLPQGRSARRLRWILAGSAIVLAVAFIAFLLWERFWLPSVEPLEQTLKEMDTTLERQRDARRLSTGGRASINPEANEYFESGVAASEKQRDLKQAMKMFKRALELDPQFAEARAWDAQVHASMVDWAYSNDSAWLYEAEEEATRALKGDVTCAEAYAVLAEVYFFQGRKELMQDAIEKAFKANVTNAHAVNIQAVFNFYTGNEAMARVQWQSMVQVGQSNLTVRRRLAEVSRTEGDNQNALRETEKTIEQNPQDDSLRADLAHIYMDSGDLRKARAAYESIHRPSPYEFYVKLTGARLLAVEGNRSAALREMDNGLLKFLQLHKGFTYEGAEVYSTAGETDKALEWLELAANGGDERDAWFRRDPMLRNIRDDPRFAQILYSVNTRRRQRPAYGILADRPPR
jgi:serine/threonine protein kinase/Tfp pilus assembly protein PilF